MAGKQECYYALRKVGEKRGWLTRAGGTASHILKKQTLIFLRSTSVLIAEILPVYKLTMVQADMVHILETEEICPNKTGD